MADLVVRLQANRANNEPRQRRKVETASTDGDVKKTALRLARNSWSRFKAYKVRFANNYPSTPESDPVAYYNNRLLEDSYAMEGGANPLPHGKNIESRQKMANRTLDYRSGLTDPSEFDKVYCTSLARRMPGYKVEISKAMSASSKIHEKDSIRTFVTKIKVPATR